MCQTVVLINVYIPAHKADFDTIKVLSDCVTEHTHFLWKGETNVFNNYLNFPLLKKANGNSPSIFSFYFTLGNSPSRTDQVNWLRTHLFLQCQAHTTTRMRVVSTMTSTGTRTAAKATSENMPRQSHEGKVGKSPTSSFKAFLSQKIPYTLFMKWEWACVGNGRSVHR